MKMKNYTIKTSFVSHEKSKALANKTSIVIMMFNISIYDNYL